MYYEVEPAVDGWKIVKDRNATAFFLDEEDAREAARMLESGEAKEADYIWWEDARDVETARKRAVGDAEDEPTAGDDEEDGSDVSRFNGCTSPEDVQRVIEEDED